MTTRDIGMVALGYGKFARARGIVALIPLDEADRGDGRRTYVYVAGLPSPIVASRSGRAILADMARTPAGSFSAPPSPAPERQAPERSAAPGVSSPWGPRRGTPRG